MEPVCLFHDDQDHVHLGSGLKLRSFISEGLHHLPQQRQHCATVTGDADAHPKVELLKKDADADISLGTGESTEGMVNGKNVNSSGTCGIRSRCNHILNSAEEDIGMGHEGATEDLDDIDATEMCFEGCVIASPTISNAIKQQTRLEYGDTYLESLTERDGMLIESVPTSSPASFFQSDTIHVPSNNSLVGRGNSWRDLPPSQQEAEYPTSSTEFDLGEERAADSIFPEIVPEGSDGISDGNFVAKNTQFMELPTPGLIDAEENSHSPKKHMENMGHPEQKNTTHGSLLKDKMARVDLCLRSVLSDPITGTFLEDAMVAQCGHSFGSLSLQKVMETHICVACGLTASPNSLVPNLALRAAVLAYKHEDQLQMTSIRGLKRRREVSEQVEGSDVKRMEPEHWGSAEHNSTDNCRSKAVQFPFVVSDKVLIRGNKRTPERFVGREAVITTQCLNGWYLVKTLDSGESVRLQYRSLEKLGDIEMPCTSEVEYFSEQGGDSSGSPVELSQGPTKAASNKELESGSPAGQRDTANGSLGQHGLEENNNNTAGSSERDLIRAPYSSHGRVDGCGISNSDGRVTSNSTLEDVLRNQGRNIEHRIGSPDKGPKTSEISREHLDNERCADLGQTVPDAMVEKFRTDLLNGISTFHDESGDEQMGQDGPQNETSSKLWFRARKDFHDPPTLSAEQVSPSKMLCTDEDATGMGGPTGNKDQESENNALRTRSRRTSLHPRNSLPVGVYGQDADPYRKVYSSGYRRRGGKVATVIPDDTVAESEVKDRGQGSIKSYSEGLHGGGSGSGTHGRAMKVKSTSEILGIMKKDMLKLERQIPRSYLLSSWRSDRITWRKGVKASCTVLELGDLVRDFRYSLLLTTAGGMSDEELEKRLTRISESGDVDLLVSLWGKLYDDVYKCVESRPKTISSVAHTLWRRLLTVEAKDVHELDLSSRTQPMPSCGTTTATTAASVGECQQASGSELKTLLESTVSLLQKQSWIELTSVKEALEREKRHIMAKLAKLEESYVKSGSTPLETSSKGPKPLGVRSNRETAQRVSIPSNQNVSSETPDDETDGENEGASPPQDADGEATDLSDSD